MSDCNGNCGGCGDSSCADRTQESFIAPMNPNSNVKKVIGIVSGKGGVGKSMVTSLLAVLMQRSNYQTAVLDADITGPSIPRSFGIKRKAMGDENGQLFPVTSPLGTKVMSINLLLENDTDPVVWRGPVIAGVIKQFWTDVQWGDVDYMFVDMPPGTGDVPLTVFQSLPLDGIIVVTSPQELVSMIVEKAVNMAKLMNVPILGVVENMAYATCPDCGKRIDIFGESHTAEIAKANGIDLIAQIPMNPKLTAACDKGMIELFEGEWLDEMTKMLEAL
ncbi:nucleotide-binding protein [Lachnospiraceae bacterium TWA4]|nr:nucleotide-binding protein [Lachnospiraceae bacterium TWA4]